MKQFRGFMIVACLLMLGTLSAQADLAKLTGLTYCQKGGAIGAGAVAGKTNLAQATGVEAYASYWLGWAGVIETICDGNGETGSAYALDKTVTLSDMTTTTQGTIGIKLASASTVGAVAFTSAWPTWGNRVGYDYAVQTTTNADPANAVDSAWTTAGVFGLTAGDDGRYVFKFTPVSGVTGVRLQVTHVKRAGTDPTGATMRELEVYDTATVIDTLAASIGTTAPGLNFGAPADNVTSRTVVINNRTGAVGTTLNVTGLTISGANSSAFTIQSLVKTPGTAATLPVSLTGDEVLTVSVALARVTAPMGGKLTVANSSSDKPSVDVGLSAAIYNPVLQEEGGTLEAGKSAGVEDIALATHGKVSSIIYKSTGGYDGGPDMLNDGLYVSTFSSAAVNGQFVGYVFNTPQTIVAMAWQSKYGGRNGGTFTVQYTKVANPSASTPDDQWVSQTAYKIVQSFPDMSSKRVLVSFPGVSGVTAARLAFDSSWDPVDILELEVYNQNVPVELSGFSAE